MSAVTSSSSRAAALAAAFLLAAAAAHAADPISWKANSVSARLPAGNEHVVLSGSAVVETKDLRITADQMEIYGKGLRYVQCSGGVHVVDAARGIDITSDELFYDRDLKIARVKGNAVMADIKNEIVAKGGFIEDRDTEHLTVIQIGVRIFRKDIECRAEFARYDRDGKILQLSGMPYVTKGADTYEGARITINLDTEAISAEGGVKGQVQDTGKDTGAGAGAAGTTGGAGAGGNGG
jgi:lipopolysaccharide export system protein LptA